MWKLCYENLNELTGEIQIETDSRCFADDDGIAIVEGGADIDAQE